MFCLVFMYFDNPVQFIQTSITNCKNRFINKECSNFGDITYVRNYKIFFQNNKQRRANKSLKMRFFVRVKLFTKRY